MAFTSPTSTPPHDTVSKIDCIKNEFIFPPISRKHRCNFILSEGGFERKPKYYCFNRFYKT